MGFSISLGLLPKNISENFTAVFPWMCKMFNTKVYKAWDDREVYLILKLHSYPMNLVCEKNDDKMVQRLREHNSQSIFPCVKG